MYILLGWFLLSNVLGFIVMGVDKKRSQKGQWRVPERRFLAVGLVGGGLGIYAGMHRFRHKTKHKSFTYGVPFMIVLNVLCYAYGIYSLLQQP